jgi:glutathione S-transferase
MITLHHLENSQSIRILWLLEELGMEYGFKMYDRDSKTMLAPDDYKALSPLGTAPVITDGDIVLAESNAIIDYIMDKAGETKFRPATTDKDRAQYLFWFHTAQGSYQSALTMSFVLTITIAKSPALIRPLIRKVLGMTQNLFLKPRLKAIMDKMEAHLSRSKFLAGDRFTAADIAVGYTLFMADLRGTLNEDYPETKAYLKRMNARPAWKTALKKDGKFKGVPS